MTVEQFHDFLKFMFNGTSNTSFSRSVDGGNRIQYYVGCIYPTNADGSRNDATSTYYESKEWPFGAIGFGEMAVDLICKAASEDLKGTDITTVSTISDGGCLPMTLLKNKSGATIKVGLSLSETNYMNDKLRNITKPVLQFQREYNFPNHDPNGPPADVEPISDDSPKLPDYILSKGRLDTEPCLLVHRVHSITVNEDGIDVVKFTDAGTQSVKPGFEIGLDTIKMPTGPYGRADVSDNQYGDYDTFIAEICPGEAAMLKEFASEREPLIEKVVELWQMNENDHWLKAAKLIARINTLNAKMRELEHKMILKRIQSANDTMDKTKNTK